MDQKIRDLTKQKREAVRNIISYLFLILVCIALVFGTFSEAVRLSNFDEIDYLIASKGDLLVRWLSKDTLSFSEFVKLSLFKIGFIENLPNLSIAEENDGFFLRHFHGVLPTYIVSLALSFTSSHDYARMLVVSSLAFILFLTLFIFILKQKQHDKLNINTIGAFAFFVASPGVIESLSSLNFHTFFSLFLVPYTYLIGVILQEDQFPKHKYYFLLGFSAAVLLLTQETAFFVFLASIFYIVCNSKDFFTKTNICYLIIGFLFCIALLSPGQLVSLDPIKSIAMYIYRISVKDMAEYAMQENKFFLLKALIAYTPIIIFALYLAVTKYSRNNDYLSLKNRNFVSGLKHQFKRTPFSLWLALSYFCLISPFVLNVTYIFPVSVLILYASVLIDDFHNTTKRFRLVSIAIFFLTTFSLIQSYLNISESLPRYEVQLRHLQREVSILETLCRKRDSNQILISTDANLLNLMLNTNCFLYSTVDYDGVTFLVRVNREYQRLDRLLETEQGKSFYMISRQPRGTHVIERALGVLDYTVVYGEIFNVYRF